MKYRLPAAIVAAVFLLSGQPGFAATTNDVSTELSVLVTSVNTKLKAGKDTEKDLANDLKAFDALYARHKQEKSEAVAKILFMKAMLYMEVLDKSDQAVALIKQVQSDFAGTKSAEDAAHMLESFAMQAKAKAVSAALVEGAAFPDFNEKDLAGKPLSVGNYKGKVVLIDFWATWCGPCVAELPNVLEAYGKYHDKGFEIIGISLDQDQDKLEKFIKQKNMTWPQYFDGKGWQNKLSTQYGVVSIPSTYLLDRNGKIIGKNLRGSNLEEAVAKAVAGK